MADFLLKGTFCPYLRASGGVLPDARLVLRRQLRSRVLHELSCLPSELDKVFPCPHNIFRAGVDFALPAGPLFRTVRAQEDR